MTTTMTAVQVVLPPALPGFEMINRYPDKMHDVFAAKILPGEYYVTRHDEMIVTVLGSCISACIRDPSAGIGGMNHFMLPADNQARGPTHVDAAARYGNYAMEHMVNDILKHGGRRERLEVKIVGGGRILAQMTDIGRRNIEFVQQYIRCEGLRLVGTDVGGIHPRKVQYFPMNGSAKVKRLTSLHNNTVQQRESEYMNELKQKPVAGDVELF